MRLRQLFFGCLSLVVLGNPTLFGQSEVLFPQLLGIQQQLQLNPAAEQYAKVSVALPAVAFHYRNSIFTRSDLDFSDGRTVRSLQGVVDRLPRQSALSSSGRVDLFGIAIRTDRYGTFSLGIAQRYDFRVAGNRDAFTFALEGLPLLLTRAIRISDYHGEGSEFAEVALGYQAPTSSTGLRWGLRAKLLSGKVNAVAQDLNANSEVLPNGLTRLSTSGTLRSSGLTEFDAGQELQAQRILQGGDNRGFAIDLGAEYAITEDWVVSAAVIDLGAIRWRSRTQVYRFSGQASTPGLLPNIDPLATSQTVFDTLARQFGNIKAGDFSEENNLDEAYTRPLFPTLNLSTTRALTRLFSVGASYRGRIHAGGVASALALSAALSPDPRLRVAVSYGLDERAIHLLGLGIVGRLGPAQLYLSSDNVLGLINYETAVATTARAGVNLVFPVGRLSLGRSGSGRKRKGSPIPCYTF